MTPSDNAVCTEAVAAMLAYEAWVVSGDCTNGTLFSGPTAESIIVAAAVDFRHWLRLAHACIEMANLRRGCTATAGRIRGQRARGVP